MVSAKKLGIRCFIVLVSIIACVTALHPNATYAAGPSITITPDAIAPNSTMTITLNGFTPEEMVTIWQTLPNESVIEHGTMQVDTYGNASLAWFADPLYPHGTHYISARGNTSTRTAIQAFHIMPVETLPTDYGHAHSPCTYPPTKFAYSPCPSTPCGPLLSVEGAIHIAATRNGNTFTFTFNDFMPQETVSIWLKTPHYTTIDLGTRRANERGTLSYTLPLGASETEGTYHLTMYGNTSNQTGTATFAFQDTSAQACADMPAYVRIIPSTVQQAGIVTLQGASFGAGEPIHGWITLADSQSMPLFSSQAKRDGSFCQAIYLPDTVAPGTYPLTVLGYYSTRRATTTLHIRR